MKTTFTVEELDHHHWAPSNLVSLLFPLRGCRGPNPLALLLVEDSHVLPAPAVSEPSRTCFSLLSTMVKLMHCGWACIHQLKVGEYLPRLLP